MCLVVAGWSHFLGWLSACSPGRHARQGARGQVLVVRLSTYQYLHLDGLVSTAMTILDYVHLLICLTSSANAIIIASESPPSSTTLKRTRLKGYVFHPSLFLSFPCLTALHLYSSLKGLRRKFSKIAHASRAASILLHLLNDGSILSIDYYLLPLVVSAVRVCTFCSTLCICTAENIVEESGVVNCTD